MRDPVLSVHPISVVPATTKEMELQSALSPFLYSGDLAVERQPSAMPPLSNPFPLGAGRDKWGLGFQLKVGAEAGSRPPGSYSWAGINNTHFWGDPVNGIGVVMLTRVLPFYDEGCIRLLVDSERCVYENL